MGSPYIGQFQTISNFVATEGYRLDYKQVVQVSKFFLQEFNIKYLALNWL
jgi:hypothetical protein